MLHLSCYKFEVQNPYRPSLSLFSTVSVCIFLWIDQLVLAIRTVPRDPFAGQRDMAMIERVWSSNTGCALKAVFSPHTSLYLSVSPACLASMFSFLYICKAKHIQRMILF
jgi:hypothetical protein